MLFIPAPQEKPNFTILCPTRKNGLISGIFYNKYPKQPVSISERSALKPKNHVLFSFLRPKASMRSMIMEESVTVTSEQAILDSGM